jgi:hypothetical protein
MILMSVLLSAQVERLSASRMQECFLEIGFVKQHIFFLHFIWLFVQFILRKLYISYVKWNLITLWYTVLDCKTLQSTKQCSTTKCSAVQCSAVQFSSVQCSAVQCSAVQCSAVQCSAVQCSAVQCSAVQCSAVQCCGVQWSAVLFYAPCSTLLCYLQC